MVFYYYYDQLCKAINISPRVTREEFFVSFSKEFCLCLNEAQFISPCVILYIIVNLPLPPLSDVFFTYHLHVLLRT